MVTFVGVIDEYNYLTRSFMLACMFLFVVLFREVVCV